MCVVVESHDLRGFGPALFTQRATLNIHQQFKTRNTCSTLPVSALESIADVSCFPYGRKTDRAVMAGTRRVATPVAMRGPPSLIA
jgi:hypothetical protein